MSFSPQNFPSAKLLCSVSKVKPQPLLRVQSSCLSDIGKTSEEGNGSFERKFVWIKCSAFFLLIKAPQRNDLQYILSFRDTMRGIMRFLLKYSLSKKWQDINIVRRGVFYGGEFWRRAALSWFVFWKTCLFIDVIAINHRLIYMKVHKKVRYLSVRYLSVWVGLR